MKRWLSVALIATALTPLPATAQTDNSEITESGDILPVPPPTFSGQSRGPALAPTESATTDRRVGDGTEASALPTVASPRNITIHPSTPSSSDQVPATLLADDLSLSGNKTVTATGGVVVWYDGARLIANQVIYHGDSGAMTIVGPIHLTEPAKAGTPDETIVIADEAQLDPNMKDGLLLGARMILAREMQMAASEIRRTGEGRYTTLDRVVASSCQVCASDPTPLWEIRARQITHDNVAHKIHFEAPQLRFFGVPVGALPALTAPDPTVSRMTGFLRPSFRTTSRLGFGIKLPYFITLGDSADVTVTPYVSASRTATVELRYRQVFSNGVTEWNGAITRDDIDPGQTRGYLFAAARFDLPRGYRLGFQLQKATDRAYLLDYDITDADRLWSGVTLDRIRRDRLIWARVGKYETLRSDENQATTPTEVADAVWIRRWRPGGVLGGEAGLRWSLHAHRRPSSRDVYGRDAARGSVTFDWNRSEILPAGVVGSIKTEVNADIYAIRQDSRYDDWFARVDPVVAGELRWPFIRAMGAVTQIIEPVIQVVWSPKNHWNDDIPNEDSQLIEFDEGNLYSITRFPGWDRRESGLRVNVGATWTRIDPTGWSIALTGGRVFRADPDPSFDGVGPLGKKHSDWLLAAQYSGNNGLAIANRALLDDSLELSRNELRLGWLKPGLEVSAGHLWMRRDESEGRLKDVSQLSATAGWQIAEGWWGTTETRYDFTEDRAQKAAVGVEYRNECLTMEMALQRRFTSSDQLKPDTTFDLGIRLGGFGQPKEGRGTVARRSCLR